MELTLKELKDLISPILRKHEVEKAGIFGSFIRKELSLDSDIDLLLELKEDKSLFDYISLKLELEELVGRKFDLVEYSTIHPRLKNRILKEQVLIL